MDGGAMSIITIARSFLGLNNTVPPTRLPLDLETGQIELAESVNMRFDDSGRGSRRDGSGLLTGGEFHSLWSWKDRYCYVGEGTDLYKVNADLSITGLMSNLSGGRISFCWTPLGIYCANGSTAWRLVDDVYQPWDKGTPPRDDDPRDYIGPPAYISHLEFFSGRIFAAVGNTLIRSLPNHYNLFRMAKDFNQVPGEIRMIKAVAGGMYISDDTKTYFAQGNDPDTWVRRTVMEVPAMEWSDTPELISPKQIRQEGDDGWACWVSANGLVFGSPVGNIIESTLNTIEIPPMSGFKQGAAVMDGDNCIYNLHQ